MILFLVKLMQVKLFAKKWHLLNFELKSVKRCLTLVEMLNIEKHSPGDEWTKLSSRYFTPLGGITWTLEQIMELQSTSLAPNFEFEQS